MTAIIELVLRILEPIVQLIFKLIGKAELRRKNYNNAVEAFQNTQQTTIDEEEAALKDLDKIN
jgi:hypothetical protein